MTCKRMHPINTTYKHTVNCKSITKIIKPKKGNIQILEKIARHRKITVTAAFHEQGSAAVKKMTIFKSPFF